MAKKKTKSSAKSSNFNESSVKAILALFILLVALGVLLIFNTYQQNILQSSFQLFMILAVLCFGFLVSLLFLVNKPQKSK